MDAKHLEKKMTTGFKLFTGFYAGAISRSEITRLAERDELDIPWNSREIDNTLNAVGKQIMVEDLFKYWHSWDLPMISIMSDAVALNFLLVMAKDWQRKGRPETKSSSDHRQFRKNAVILLDKSIYEYVTKKWRGSSDSRIATNLREISTMPSLFEPVPDEAWIKLVEEVIEEGKIEGVSYTSGNDKRIKLLLCYYYCIKGIEGPKSDPLCVESDMDHIIPKTQFESTPRSDLRALTNNIVNLALLPRRQNISKSDKRLNEITDNWMIKQIEKYEEIRKTDFPKYSDATQIFDLKQYRGPMLRQGLCEDRKNMIDRAV